MCDLPSVGGANVLINSQHGVKPGEGEWEGGRGEIIQKLISFSKEDNLPASIRLASSLAFLGANVAFV